MTYQHHETGKLGERIAREYLEKQGYCILDTGARTKFGELDIVAREGETMVFVEVKTRRGNMFGRPEDAVDRRKQHHLAACAHAYLYAHKLLAAPFRIDTIAIEMDEATHKAKLRHLKHAVPDQESN